MSIRIKIKKSDSDLEENKLQKTNCRVDRLETEQEIEKKGSGKDAKEVPVWKQTRKVVCDLTKQLEETSEDKILVDKQVFNILLDKASTCLDVLIEEEQTLSEEDKYGNENRRERNERLFGPFMKTFYQLSKGIYEERKKKPLCSPRGMNPNHDADGEFSTASNAKSWSVRQGYGKKNCRSGQRSSNPSRWTTVVCGRKNRLDPDIKAPNKCKKTNESLDYLEVYDRWSKLFRV